MISYQKILFPTDYSAVATHAFAAALGIARQFDAALEVIHVLPMSADADQREAERLSRWVGEHDGTVAAQRLVKAISPDIGILEEVERTHTDLVVIGTRGHSGFQGLLLGSCAERVVRLAPCPVLTIHLGDPADAGVAP